MKKKFYLVLGIVSLLFVQPRFALAATDNYTGIFHNGSSTVPVRGVFQSMGADVQWEPSAQKITIKKNELSASLQVNNKKAYVNGNEKTLEFAPFVQNGITYLPLRFISEAIGAEVKWEQSSQTAYIHYENKMIPVKIISKPTQVSNAKITSFTKKVNGVHVTGVNIPANAGFKAKMVVANGQLGTTQSLAGMAGSHQAIAAINGTFFGAYGGSPDPWNQIIKDGKVIHIGNTGSTFGFTSSGNAKLEKLKIKVNGSTDGSYKYPNNWYAFGLNHMPSKNANLAYLFTPEWGKTLRFNYGTNIVIADGVVTKIVTGDANIPPNGFVLSLHGTEKSLSSRFKVGTKVNYEISFTNEKGEEVDWNDVITAVGAGPSLVMNGKVIVDGRSEGFTEAKILTQSFSRSAIGVNAQGDVILVNANATMQKLAEVMKALGAIHAMNLDGGASSGIYFNGSYLVKPGRNLSNALIFSK